MELVYFAPVMTVMIDALNDTCPICRNNICDRCIACQANEEVERQIDLANTCEQVVGVCGHAYHVHCLATAQAKQAQKQCLIDMKPWQVAK
jgi:hypothetical protein